MRMDKDFSGINMAALHDQIERLLAELENYSLTKGLA